jgi:hypothetical protein
MDLVVRWDKMGPEFTYEVWYAKNPAGPWIRHHDIRLTDDVVDLLRGIHSGEYYESVSYNEYYLSGLDEETNYSVKVTCSDRYDSWWYSQASYDSIGGGLSSPFARPNPDGGNLLNLQYYINI